MSFTAIVSGESCRDISDVSDYIKQPHLPMWNVLHFCIAKNKITKPTS